MKYKIVFTSGREVITRDVEAIEQMMSDVDNNTFHNIPIESHESVFIEDKKSIINKNHVAYVQAV